MASLSGIGPDSAGEYFASVVDASPDCIRILDLEGRVEFMNARGLALFEIADFSPNAGCYWVDLWPPTARAQIKDAVASARVGKTTTFTAFCPTARGAEKWWETTVAPVRGGDEAIVRLLATSRDVTERRASRSALKDALAKAEAASQAKSDFLATMSHEIRTPLNAVLGMVQAMQADDLPPAQRERLRIVHRSGHVLLAVLNDVLDLSRIEAGQLALHETEFDMEHLARGTAMAFQQTARKAGVDLTVTIDAAARGTFRGDATRLRQILYNLLSNAVKFTSAGRIDLDLAYRAPNIVIAIRDTGVGIAADRQAAIFDKFIQGDSSNTRRHGGSGLGLAISQSLARMMGGDISLVSEEGRGSTFTLSAPLPRLGDTQPLANTAPARAPDLTKDAPHGLKVLAAEDNETNQVVLRTLLQQAGVEPTIVADGQQALDAWEADVWDLILMDIQMPVMDGPTAVRQIRAREAREGRRRTPIIAITANTLEHQLREYVEAGMDDVVAKPVDVMRLYAALEKALETVHA